LALPGPTALPPEEPLTPATAASAEDNLPPAEPTADAPTPGELAAWVSALPLPLPRPTPAADESAPKSAKTSLPVVAMTPGPAAHAAAVALANAAEREARPAIELPAVGPRAPETTAVVAAPARGAARGTATPAAAATSAATPQLPTIEAALRATGLVRETAPAGGAEGATPLPGMALLQGAAQRPADIATPLQIEVREPVDSKAFAPALGAQLSVLVRNGIEHAQLQLHPADLGPIDVRIRVDGQEAQVDFSAAHAATRQALQDAVPTLAGALRDSGLTLTGGGVYEQARDPRGQPQPQAARGQAGAAVDDGAAALPAPAARGVRARGVVDLYA
jgi:flagellar hook-length control protein FliK